MWQYIKATWEGRRNRKGGSLMQKEELFRLLQDPDVCREIFLIVKNGGKLNVQAAAPKAAPSADAEKLASIKN